jgi:hypothetical protein
VTNWKATDCELPAPGQLVAIISNHMGEPLAFVTKFDGVQFVDDIIGVLIQIEDVEYWYPLPVPPVVMGDA